MHSFGVIPLWVVCWKELTLASLWFLPSATVSHALLISGPRLSGCVALQAETSSVVMNPSQAKKIKIIEGNTSYCSSLLEFIKETISPLPQVLQKSVRMDRHSLTQRACRRTCKCIQSLWVSCWKELTLASIWFLPSATVSHALLMSGPRLSGCVALQAETSSGVMNPSQTKA